MFIVLINKLKLRGYSKMIVGHFFKVKRSISFVLLLCGTQVLGLEFVGACILR